MKDKYVDTIAEALEKKAEEEPRLVRIVKNGVETFILLDKDGKPYDSDAPRHRKS